MTHPTGLAVNGLFGTTGSIDEADTVLTIENSMDLEFIDQTP